MGVFSELIQNAEDAEATQLDFIYLPPDAHSGHALALGPGLLVVNDGVFRDEHRHAIFQINLGTKGTDDRAIGQFGKGLKSVFAWCDAFSLPRGQMPIWVGRSHQSRTSSILGTATPRLGRRVQRVRL